MIYLLNNWQAKNKQYKSEEITYQIKLLFNGKLYVNGVQWSVFCVQIKCSLSGQKKSQTLRSCEIWIQNNDTLNVLSSHLYI